MSDERAKQRFLYMAIREGLAHLEEAAHYCGVSNSQFRKNALAYHLVPERFMGKQLYSRADL